MYGSPLQLKAEGAGDLQPGDLFQLDVDRAGEVRLELELTVLQGQNLAADHASVLEGDAVSLLCGKRNRHQKKEQSQC